MYYDLTVPPFHLHNFQSDLKFTCIQQPDEDSSFTSFEVSPP